MRLTSQVLLFCASLFILGCASSSGTSSLKSVHKVFVVDFAIQQFWFLYPTETLTEKRIKLFYEEEVGAKSTSVGSFNMSFNMSKTLTDDAKELLKN